MKPDQRRFGAAFRNGTDNITSDRSSKKRKVEGN